jgi:hypothetical protein
MEVSYITRQYSSCISLTWPGVGKQLLCQFICCKHCVQVFRLLSSLLQLIKLTIVDQSDEIFLLPYGAVARSGAHFTISLGSKMTYNLFRRTAFWTRCSIQRLIRMCMYRNVYYLN